MCDKSRLADDQRARYARTCGIVFDHGICGCVLGVSPVSSQGCHNYSVLEGYRPELDGLKELGSGHSKGCVLERFVGCRFPRIQPSFIEGKRKNNGGRNGALTSSALGKQHILQFAEVDDHSGLSEIMGFLREVGE
jgi:hypothetical protein